MRVRLQKLLASAGVASRRQAEALLRAGRVELNGRPAQVGESADPEVDRVTLDGRLLGAEALEYWIVHKPRGVLSTARDPEGRRTILELLPHRSARVFPVGRLDRDTEGLVLLTNDGLLAHTLLHPSRENPREYEVTVRGEPVPETLARLARGVRLDDGLTAPARVQAARFDARSGAARFSLTLGEGRKRQIRRALAALGHPVVRLVRVGFGPLRLGRLAPGAARRLTAAELRALRSHARALEERVARLGDRRAVRSRTPQA